MTETVSSDLIRWGDWVEVNLGQGRLFRPVDRVVRHDDGGVDITLYSPFGRRPVVKVAAGVPIVRRT